MWCAEVGYEIRQENRPALLHLKCMVFSDMKSAKKAATVSEKYIPTKYKFINDEEIKKKRKCVESKREKRNR
jgi:hypothetical protein